MSADLGRCQSCGELRGKRGERAGWHPEQTAGVVNGWTCPACPWRTEPIRRIESRGRVRFRAVVDVSAEGAPRRQETRTCDTLAEAREHVERTREHVSRGTYSRERVADLAEAWLASRTDVRAVTVQGYRTALRPFVARLGERRVSEVRPSDVQAFVAWAVAEGGMNGKPLSPRSVRYALVAAGQAFDDAVREGTIPANPVRFAKPPRQAPKSGGEAGHWTRAEVDRFREVSDADALAGVWRLSLAGMTRADVHGLMWSDIDLNAGTVSIARGRVALQGGETATDDPKSSARQRTLPIEQVEPGTIAALRSLRAAQAADRLRAGAAWHDSGFVVVDAIGRPEHPERYSERFRALAAQAGLPPIRLHALRHSLAAWFDLIGVAPSAGAAWLGHTLNVYLGTYFPERGAEGIASAAEVMVRARAV